VNRALSCWKKSKIHGKGDSTFPDLALAQAERHEVVMTGGAMGRMAGAMMHGRRMNPREMMRAGAFWALNGRAQVGGSGEGGYAGVAPLLRLRRGGSHRIAFVNQTRWPHPMHLHGHHVRVLTRQGRPEPHRPWRDTVLLAPRERVEVALVADNPGTWLLHCHILSHQTTGMAALVEVA
jgi:FtsP/CotA-like multicopper oxidase with cupredoxin domain